MRNINNNRSFKHRSLNNWLSSRLKGETEGLLVAT